MKIMDTYKALIKNKKKDAEWNCGTLLTIDVKG